ncbi:hypothetical protein YC2023_004424 [Brassica napus]
MCALSVNLDEVRPWIRHLEGMVSLCMISWSCHQTCGARGAATHASGAMRSDTRAATNLKLIGWCLLYKDHDPFSFHSSRPFKSKLKKWSAPREGSGQLKINQLKINSDGKQVNVASSVQSAILYDCDAEALSNSIRPSQSYSPTIKWRCCPRLVQFHGFRSVEVLLVTPPKCPKNCPAAKGDSVQISLSRRVSFFMMKPRLCPSQDQSSAVQSRRPLGFGQVLYDQPAASRLEHCELVCLNSTWNLGFPLSLKIVSQREAGLSGVECLVRIWNFGFRLGVISVSSASYPAGSRKPLIRWIGKTQTNGSDVKSKSGLVIACEGWWILKLCGDFRPRGLSIQYTQDIRGCPPAHTGPPWLSVSTHRTLVAVRVCPSAHIGRLWLSISTHISTLYTHDVYGCPSAHTGRPWVSVSTHRTSMAVRVCPSSHTGRLWLSISTHVSTLVLGLSTLTLPVDSSGDFGPRGLSVQYTQDVRGCPPAHTHTQDVRGCPCVYVSTHRTSMAVHQYTYQHAGPWTQDAGPSRGLLGGFWPTWAVCSVHTERPWVSVSTHRMSVGVRQHTQDVCGCPCVSVSTHWTSVAVRLCPSPHTGRLWLSISTHISTLAVGLSTLALSVDCSGDFGPRGLSVQYTQDVCGCPSAHTGRPWVSVSTHRKSVAVCLCLCVSVCVRQHTQDVRGCPSVHISARWSLDSACWPFPGTVRVILAHVGCLFSTHRTSAGVRQHTQDVRGCPTHRTSVFVCQHTHDIRGCPSAHTGRQWLSVCVRVCPSAHMTFVAVHQYTYQHVGPWTQHAALLVDCSGDFGQRGLSVQYTQDVCGTHITSVAVRVCSCVSVSTHMTSVAVHQYTYQHAVHTGGLWVSVSTHMTSVGVRQHTQNVCGCPSAHTGRLWVSVSTHRTSVGVRQHTQDVCGCPSAHTGRLWVSVSTHRTSVGVRQHTQDVRVCLCVSVSTHRTSVPVRVCSCVSVSRHKTSTHDVRGCPPAHTGRLWLSVAVRLCPCVSVSTHRTSVAVHQYTYQHVVHTGRPRVSASTHRTSVAVSGCLSAHTGRPWLSVCVCVCPSRHTGRLWLSISTHISTLVLGLSTLALPVDCSGDFVPRRLSVQYTEDVRGCPSSHTGQPWVSVSTHRTSVAVRVCPSAHTGRPRSMDQYMEPNQPGYQNVLNISTEVHVFHRTGQIDRAVYWTIPHTSEKELWLEPWPDYRSDHTGACLSRPISHLKTYGRARIHFGRAGRGDTYLGELDELSELSDTTLELDELSELNDTSLELNELSNTDDGAGSVAGRNGPFQPKEKFIKSSLWDCFFPNSTSPFLSPFQAHSHQEYQEGVSKEVLYTYQDVVHTGRPRVSASTHKTSVAVRGYPSVHTGRLRLSVSTHRTSVAVCVCPSAHTRRPWLSICTHISTLALHVDCSGDFGPRGLSVQYTQDVRGCPSAHTGRPWVSVSTHRMSVAVRVCPCVSISAHRTSVAVRVCPSAHTGRPWLSICTHISTLALPADCSGDFGPRGLSVQYTQDIRRCPLAHTGRPWLSVAVRQYTQDVRGCLWLSVAVRVCPSAHTGRLWLSILHTGRSWVSVSTHRTSVGVRQHTQDVCDCPCVSVSTHRTFVAARMCRQHTQDVCGCPSVHISARWSMDSARWPFPWTVRDFYGCPSVHTGRPWLSVAVRVCPSAHTGRPWLSICTHISTLVLGLSRVAFPVDCSGDFGPRGLSVQYTQDVLGCPSAHTGRPWVSVITHTTSVAARVCPSAHTGRLWLSISTHISTLVLGVSMLALPVDCSGDFGPRGLSVQYTQDVRGCPSAHTGCPWVSVAVRHYTQDIHGCPWVSVSTHRTSVAVRLCPCVFVCVRQHTQDVCGCPLDVRVCPSAYTGRPWLSICTHVSMLVLGLSTLALPVDCLGHFGPRGLSVQYTQDVRQHTQDVRGCPPAHTGRPWLSISTHISTLVLGLSTLALPVDCLGDFGPRGLFVQYTQDVCGCL